MSILENVNYSTSVENSNPLSATGLYTVLLACKQLWWQILRQNPQDHSEHPASGCTTGAPHRHWILFRLLLIGQLFISTCLGLGALYDTSPGVIIPWTSLHSLECHDPDDMQCYGPLIYCSSGQAFLFIETWLKDAISVGKMVALVSFPFLFREGVYSSPKFKNTFPSKRELKAAGSGSNWTFGHACVGRSVLIVLFEVTKSVHCGWYHSLPGILDCINGERQMNSSKHL